MLIMKIEISRKDLYDMMEKDHTLFNKIDNEIERGGLIVDYRSHPDYEGREYLFDIQSDRDNPFSDNQV
jgi:hypothetical protein